MNILNKRKCSQTILKVLKILRIFSLCCLWGLFFAPLRLLASTAPSPPTHPVNDRDEAWEKKVLSTASGMIHIQWSYEGPEPPDSYLIYRREGEVNPLATEAQVQLSTPWQTVPNSRCFFRYFPGNENDEIEDEDALAAAQEAEEGKKYWFLVRAVKGDKESTNLDTEAVVVDFPWIGGLNDPNFINFYVEDDQRQDSFLQDSLKCPFCSESSKTYFRLVRAHLAFRREFAWYYVDRAYNPPADLAAIADCFENEIYPTNLQYFGRSNSPWADVDENGHITILFTKLNENIEGYFNTDDKIPGGYKFKEYVGNCSDMFYISTSSSTGRVKRTIAHEFQHMQHLEANAEDTESRGDDSVWEELWLDEACSEFANEVNNLYSRGLEYFKERPHEVSLTRFGYFDVHDRFGGCPIHWNQSQQNRDAIYRVIAHYEKVSLWAHYMEYNTSPITALKDLVDDPNTGLISVQDHIGLDFNQAFVNWTVANYVNPYASGDDIRYHYSAKFPSKAYLLETQSVKPKFKISSELIKSLDQEPLWQEGSLRDLAADYIPLPHNSLSGDRIHWEVKGINGQENVCNLALIDQTDPNQPSLHEVVSLAISNSAGVQVILEKERDFSSCLIVSNLAQYQDDNYSSTYQYRAFLTKSPKLLRMRLKQGENEWSFEGSAGAGSGSQNRPSVLVSKGLLQIIIQFDQSMSQAVWPLVYLHPQEERDGDDYGDGDGDGDGVEAIAAQPAAGPWSSDQYPVDTWSGNFMIPTDNSQKWDGPSEIIISGGENHWHEPMETVERLSISVGKNIVLTDSNLGLCFIAEIARICWDRDYHPDLLGYHIYGTSRTGEPVWIPREELTDPNHPSYPWPNPGPGIYSIYMTKLYQNSTCQNATYQDVMGDQPVEIDNPDLQMVLSVGLNMISWFQQQEGKWISSYHFFGQITGR